jgi:hypothetical protein
MRNGAVVTSYLTSSMATRQALPAESPFALGAYLSYVPDEAGAWGAVSHFPLSPAVGYGNPFVVTVRVPANPSSWIGSAISKLEKLSELSDDWDSYGGKAIERDALLMALNLIGAIYSARVPEPAIVPVATGGIQFEWHTRQKELEISLSPNGQASLYFEEIGKPLVSSVARSLA